MYTWIFIRAIFAGQKVETTQMSLNQGKDKPNMVEPYSDYSVIKRNEVKRNEYNMDEPWKQYAKGKDPDTEDHMLYDSIYKKYSE